MPDYPALARHGRLWRSRPLSAPHEDPRSSFRRRARSSSKSPCQGGELETSHRPWRCRRGGVREGATGARRHTSSPHPASLGPHPIGKGSSEIESETSHPPGLFSAVQTTPDPPPAAHGLATAALCSSSPHFKCSQAEIRSQMPVVLGQEGTDIRE